MQGPTPSAPLRGCAGLPCGMQAPLVRPAGTLESSGSEVAVCRQVCPTECGILVFPIRDRTHVSCIGKQVITNGPQEVPKYTDLQCTVQRILKPPPGSRHRTFSSPKKPFCIPSEPLFLPMATPLLTLLAIDWFDLFFKFI